MCKKLGNFFIAYPDSRRYHGIDIRGFLQNHVLVIDAKF